MIYKIFDEAGKYRGYKTVHTLNSLKIPFSVEDVKTYPNGICVVLIIGMYRTKTEDINDTRIALNNIIRRQELLSHLHFNI